jgi:hypothetical protein
MNTQKALALLIQGTETAAKVDKPQQRQVAKMARPKIGDIFTAKLNNGKEVQNLVQFVGLYEVNAKKEKQNIIMFTQGKQVERGLVDIFNLTKSINLYYMPVAVFLTGRDEKALGTEYKTDTKTVKNAGTYTLKVAEKQVVLTKGSQTTIYQF